MAFCITFGTHTFTSQLKDYEGVIAQCHNCGNWSGHCVKSWEWVTICFLPVVPLSLKPYQDVACPICNFKQDMKNRPDVQSQHLSAQNPLPLPAGAPAGPGPGPGYGAPPQYK